MPRFDRFTWLSLALLLLAAFSLRSIWKSRAHARRVKVIWSAIAIVPLFGPLAWFVLGRDRRRR